MGILRPKVGDIFEVFIGEGKKAHLQYIADDATQLNSEVIRVFTKQYSLSDDVNLTDVVADKVKFYAHTVLYVGAKMGLWKKVGNCQELGHLDVYFSTSEDHGRPEVKYSDKWWVWKVNEDMRFVGKLTGEYAKSELGSVIPAPFVVDRINTGKYQFVYPASQRES